MMSDASGPTATIGLNGYLTGYPLSESGHYALARTWPAPELPRPGCVWTHTILIDFSDIPSLVRVDGLLKLFRRPQGDENSYRRELDYVPSEESERLAIPEDLVRRILSASTAILAGRSSPQRAKGRRATRSFLRYGDSNGRA